MELAEIAGQVVEKAETIHLVTEIFYNAGGTVLGFKQVRMCGSDA